MSKPRPPAPPDPVAMSNAQRDSNLETARTEAQLNRVNQVTPYGAVNYSNAGDQWTQTVTESDAQRQLREGQERSGIALGNLGEQQIGRVGDILGQNFTPRRLNNADVTGGPLDLARALGEYSNSQFDPRQAQSLNLQRFDPSGSAGQFDPRGVAARNNPMAAVGRYDPTTQLGDFGQDIANRAYAGATAGMDRSFGQADEALRTRLANQGITADSDAFRSERSGFEQGRANAYAQAYDSAQRTGLAARGQAAGELGQGFGQMTGAMGQNFGQQAGAMGQGFAQNLSAMGAGANLEMARNQDQLSRQAMAGDLYNQQYNQRLNDMMLQRGTNLAEAQDQYGRDYSADLAQRQIPLQEITAILNGTPITPLNPAAPAGVNVAGTNVLGAYQMQQQGMMNNYNAQMQQRNALIGALGGLGGAALGRGG